MLVFFNKASWQIEMTPSWMRPRRNEKQIFQFTYNLINAPPPPWKVLPSKPCQYWMKGDPRLKVMLSRPSPGPPALWEWAPPALAACLLSSSLHYPTDDLSDRHPSCSFLPAAFSENKACNPFYLHSAPFPSSVFSKDRLPASLAPSYPVEQAMSSELTILTFCCLWFF